MLLLEWSYAWQSECCIPAQVVIMLARSALQKVFWKPPGHACLAYATAHLLLLQLHPHTLLHLRTPVCSTSHPTAPASTGAKLGAACRESQRAQDSLAEQPSSALTREESADLGTPKSVASGRSMYSVSLEDGGLAESVSDYLPMHPSSEHAPPSLPSLPPPEVPVDNNAVTDWQVGQGGAMKPCLHALLSPSGLLCWSQPCKSSS